MIEKPDISPPGVGHRVPNPVLERIEEFAGAIHADGITVWLAGPGFLEAVANPLEPEIIGMRQPTDRGLISQVYLTGQAILEHSLAANPLHDPVIDRQLGRSCRAMMAAPLEFDEAHRLGQGGVVSAVVWRDDNRLTGFSLDGLNRLAALARTIVSEWNDPT
jgi:hypothetical protein